MVEVLPTYYELTHAYPSMVHYHLPKKSHD